MNEGSAKHFLRSFYLALGALFGVGVCMTAYTESSKFLMVYEDYLDWVVF